MTLQEYDKMMEEYCEIKKKREEFLFNKLKECYAKDPNDEARQIACDIFYYGIYLSMSGRSDSHAASKELAHKVFDILVKDFGDLLLDYPDIYKEDNEYVISAQLGKNYCLSLEG